MSSSVTEIISSFSARVALSSTSSSPLRTLWSLLRWRFAFVRRRFRRRRVSVTLPVILLLILFEKEPKLPNEPYELLYDELYDTDKVGPNVGADDGDSLSSSASVGP